MMGCTPIVHGCERTAFLTSRLTSSLLEETCAPIGRCFLEETWLPQRPASGIEVCERFLESGEKQARRVVFMDWKAAHRVVAVSVIAKRRDDRTQFGFGLSCNQRHGELLHDGCPPSLLLHATFENAAALAAERFRDSRDSDSGCEKRRFADESTMAILTAWGSLPDGLGADG